MGGSDGQACPRGGSSEQGLLSEDSSLQPDARTENLRTAGCVSRRVAGREALYGQVLPEGARGSRASKVFFPRTQACSLMLGRKICERRGAFREGLQDGRFCNGLQSDARTEGGVRFEKGACMTGMSGGGGGSSEQGLLSEDSSLQPDARKGLQGGRFRMDRHARGGSRASKVFFPRTQACNSAENLRERRGAFREGLQDGRLCMDRHAGGGGRANKVFFPRTQACSLMLGRKIRERRGAFREGLQDGRLCMDRHVRRGVRANKVFFPRTQACSLMLGRKICERRGAFREGLQDGRLRMDRHARGGGRANNIRGAPGRTRTCSLLLRRQLLYPLSYGRALFWCG